jgi:hypothetical protein
MKSSIRWLLLGAALSLAATSFAQVPADAPAGTTGVCNDGSYSQAAVKKGACRGHKGVKQWYAAAGSSAGTTTGTATAGAAAAAPTAPAAPPAAPSPKGAASTSGATSSYTPPANPAAGGGPGMVWVNTSSNVYHCPGDKWYGKTKHGQYMTEAEAKAKNARPDHGKACQS